MVDKDKEAAYIAEHIALVETHLEQVQAGRIEHGERSEWYDTAARQYTALLKHLRAALALAQQA